jgi:hypothetical protein
MFGVGAGAAPQAVKDLAVARDSTDRRKVLLSWKPAAGATAYLVRYGITPHQLYQHDFVAGGDATGVTLFGLNNDPPYHFRIDAINAAGRTTGEIDVTAP